MCRVLVPVIRTTTIVKSWRILALVPPDPAVPMRLEGAHGSPGVCFEAQAGPGRALELHRGTCPFRVHLTAPPRAVPYSFLEMSHPTKDGAQAGTLAALAAWLGIMLPCLTIQCRKGMERTRP